MTKQESIKDLQLIPGIGKKMATDLFQLGYTSVADLKNEDPELMYVLHNNLKGVVQDICVLYTFRCAVYFAKTQHKKQDPEKLKWWHWMDKVKVDSKTKDQEIRKRIEMKVSLVHGR